MDFGQTMNYAANAVNAYTALSGGGYAPPAPTYDARGNTLRLPRWDGSALNLAWTAFDRLASVNGSTLLRYDALGPPAGWSGRKPRWIDSKRNT